MTRQQRVLLKSYYYTWLARSNCLPVANQLWRLHIPLVPRWFCHQLGRFGQGLKSIQQPLVKAFFIDHGMGVVVGETAIR